MVNASFVLITTLIVIALANLLLLVHMIIRSYDAGDCKKNSDKRQYRNEATMEKFVENYKTSVAKYKFMAALILVKNDEIEFICSACIVSPKWVLTPAHCAEHLKMAPLNSARISSNSSRWKYGIWHDIDRIIIHEDFNPANSYNDLALIRVHQPFGGRYELPVKLPEISYKYQANTTTTALGWMKSSQHLYRVDIKLFWYKLCELHYPQMRAMENGMLCAGRFEGEQNFCVFDDGGILIQHDVLIGITSFGVGCELLDKPGVFTKIAAFADWLKYTEKREGVVIGAIFKKH